MALGGQIDGVPGGVEVDRDGQLHRFRFGDGPERQAQIAEVEPGVFSVLLDGQSYEARTERRDEDGNGSAWITVRGRRFHIAVNDPRRWTESSAAAHGPVRETILASIPGKIVRVLAQPLEPAPPEQASIL